MKAKKSLLSLIFLIFPFLLVSRAYSNQWMLFHDGEIKGSVIDVETQKPIEGVIVVGMWRLSQFLSQGFGGYAKVIVEKTDKSGQFIISSWTTFKPWTLDSSMHDLAPEIVIYKPGYKLYFSHRVEREGFPGDISKTEEEKEKLKEKYSLNPAKLAKIYTDEERLQNESDWGTWARFPDEFYSKEQAKIIFDALEEEILQVSDKNKDKAPLLKSIKKMRDYWAGGKK